MGSRRELRWFWPLPLCLLGTSLGCDRSWRDENFVTPGAGPNTPEEPPRVRPTVPGPTAGDGSTRPSSPGASETAPTESEPPLADASVPGPEPDPTGQDTDEGVSTAGVDTGETESPSPVGSNTNEPDVASSGEAPSSEPPAPTPFTKGALLAAATECAMDQYAAFSDAASRLEGAVAQLVSQPEEQNAARRAFSDALLAFQRVELFRIGPAARAMDPGGLDLRDRIYAYPQLNRCQVDRNLVSQVYASDFAAVLSNARGLGALEYLLYEQGTKNACSSGVDINSRGTWAQVSTSELRARRAAYAKAVAEDIAARAGQLVDAWRPSGGNFRGVVLGAGKAGSVFASEQAALNAFSHALFYVEKEVKDYKLGWPLGLVAECTSGSCPYASELPYSGLSGPSIAENLAAFRLLFEGCGPNYTGLGFDDWLRMADPEGDLAERMLSRVNTAQAVVAALPRPLEDAFYDAPAEAQQVHAAVKAITDLLKTEFVSLLNLELPMTAEGDND